MACGCYPSSFMSCFLHVWLAIQLSITPVIAICLRTVYKYPTTVIKGWLAVIGSYVPMVDTLTEFSIFPPYTFPQSYTFLPWNILSTLAEDVDTLTTWSLLPYRSIRRCLHYTVWCKLLSGPSPCYLFTMMLGTELPSEPRQFDVYLPMTLITLLIHVLSL